MPDEPEPNAAHPESGQQPDSAWVLGGRYRIIDRLGLGGMAEVFRAHDDLLDRDVAVKVFRSGVGGDDDTHGEVRRELELQSLARLSHPNLITLFDGSVAGDGPAYLVLELVNGPDLASRLREGPLSEREARELGAQIADALAYVHARGMVHRDVKPANILLGVDEAMPGAVRSRLSDFGIVRMIGSERLTSVDMTLGTASYIAPEQAKGANVGPAADVYSLALVLIESLTGVRCFDGPVHEALAARLTTAPQIPPGLPTPWPELLAAMTVQDPDDRPAAAEVARSLREGVPPAVTPVADVPADMSPGTAAATVAAAGLTAVAGGAAAAAAAVPTGASAAIPTGAVAGIPAAAGMGTGALAAAPTGRVAPVATGGVPVAMPGPAGPAPPVTYAPWDDEPYDGDARRGRRGMTLVLAAIAFAALMAGAGFLLLGGSPSSPADTTTTTTQPSVPKTTTAHRKTSQAAVVATTHSSSSSTSHSASKSATPTRSTTRSTSAARSSSAPRPVTSTSASVSSSASTSSPPPPSDTAVAAGAIGSPAPPTP
ncbi:MAG: serine/threonine-protein kinase [Jatrophihabitans sp.]|uniref:serine/threonine-protein kinase n=1 Tax=Jatrophihabitans sp. TaxID=1932789 RepID=UPI0039159CFC